MNLNENTNSMIKEYYVYILTNQHRNVLYIGVTNNLTRRVAEHKAKLNKGFTYKYNCEMLVFYETLPNISQAITRE